MDAILSKTLIKRRDELLIELQHIEELLKIYQGAVSNAEIKNDAPIKLVRTKFPKRRHNVKGQVISILKELGDEFYVVDLTKALQAKEPNKDHKLISNKARNYIHILKKEGVITGKLVENNKYVYSVVKK
jgi:hypothetical protein